MVVTLKVIKRFALVSLDDIGYVLIGMHISDARAFACADERVANGVNKVGFTQTDTAI